MSFQQEKFTEIANAIRGKLGTTDPIKPSDFASKISEIQGGGDSWYDIFWDNFQNGGNTGVAGSYGSRKHYNYAFYQIGWNDNNYNPKYDFNIANAYAMFHTTAITDTKKPLDFTKLLDPASNVFMSANLKTIRTITVNENTTYNAWFNNASGLENITFDGKIGKNISFAQSPLLSAESVQNIIDHLATVTTPTTITFHANVMEQLTPAQKATISQKGGWSIAL